MTPSLPIKAIHRESVDPPSESSKFICGKNRHFDTALPSIHPIAREVAHTSPSGVAGKLKYHSLRFKRLGDEACH
ncbi:hypothetical protein [Jeotgalibaca sp. A127]|uniref:hypothetical protein n=1 Tax=Jeotgalibaca sp. A127 TaxID=3457324 RepID=UPI003FD6624E